jgi:hypothetical protein
MDAAIELLGAAAGVDALACIGERAAITGRRARGRVSCGGASRLLPTADSWMALSLARPDDVDLVPAWLGVEESDDPWAVVADAVRDRPAGAVVERGRLLGLPVAALGERPPGPLFTPTRLGDASPIGRPALVVDLSSLWAGPLCGRILREHGARVVKVESPNRPDGARLGHPRFFHRLNEGKEQRTLVLDGADLRGLLLEADVVIEGSRPRALEQVGIDAASIVAAGPRVWLSITGHGRTGPARDWVAFGDDAAVAGGLVTWDDDGPCFFADAVADPLTGMAGAVAVTSLLEAGGRWLVDCSLAGVAAHVAAAA